MSNIETAAILSQKIYENLDKNQMFGEGNRYKVMDAINSDNLPQSGYYGAIILDTQTNTNYLVNRGTDLSSIADLSADLDVAFGGVGGSQFADALSFLESYVTSSRATLMW